MSSRILPCKCVSEQQDKLNGKGQRLHNECKAKTTGQYIWRCIVCKVEKTTDK